jgi:histidine triad (HIT) family protein
MVAQDENCPFCHIVAGDAPAELIAEAETWVAFFPLAPATPGHTLVVPRLHVADLWAADPDLVCDLARGAHLIGRAIETALAPDGMNLISSSGSVAEQSVFHLHLHVVPRRHDDGFGEIWPPTSASEPEALEETANSIRGALAI